MSKVTKLKPRNVANVESVERLDARKGYRDTIQSTALEVALDELRGVAWEVAAVVHLAAMALADVSAELAGPDYTSALHGAVGRLRRLADALEAGPLEDRADEIAKEREAKAAGGAA
jgi:hypothetical protein